MPKLQYLLTAGLIICSTGAAAHAQKPRLNREYRSENKKFTLKIRPGRRGRTADSVCQASLFASDGPRKQRWERPLVNQIAPQAGAVRDDGKFVVTLGEFPFGGVHNALVIYGAKGQLLRHFLLTDLLTSDDWRHVKRRKRAIEWLNGAKSEFRDNPDEFVLTFKWGRELRVDLKTLQIVREGKHARPGQGIPEDILAALAEGASSERDLFAGLSEQDAEVLAAMLEPVTENGLEMDEGAEVIKIDAVNAEAALAALEDKLATMGGDEETRQRILETVRNAIQNMDGEISLAIQAQSGDGGHAEMSRIMIRAGANAAQKTSVGLDDVPTPGMDDTFAAESPRTDSAGVPMPEPGEHIDYLKWLNERSRVDGAGAAPYFEAAIDEFVKFEGDDKLYRAAIDGDPDALESPEISDWLEANRDALSDYRAATDHEFRGFEMKSENGDMIGALLPGLSPMRNLARAGIIEGRRLAAEGRMDEAIDVLLDTREAGGQTGNGPTLIENLVGTAIQRGAADAILDLAADDREGRIDYESLANRLEASRHSLRSMADAIQFEKASYLDTVQRLYIRDEATGEVRVTPEGLRYGMGAMAAVGADLGPLDAMGQAWNLAGLDYHDTVQRGTQYYDALAEAASLPYDQALSRMRELEQGVGNETNPITRSLLPALSRAFTIRTRNEAQQRGTLLVSRIKAYEQKYGTLPDSLDAFGDGQFTIDPFSNARFRYERTAEGFRLYSAGEDGIDNGGIGETAEDARKDLIIWPRPRK